MHRRYAFLFILMAILFGRPDLAAQLQPELHDPDADSPSSVRVKFELYQGYLIVAQGEIGSLKHLNFLFDTGTTPTIVDPRIAGRLHLKNDRTANIVVVGGRAVGGETVVPELSFGPVRRTNLRVVTEDLSFLHNQIPVRIDAIIGLDTLRDSAFGIDYRAREIRFGRVPLLSSAIHFTRIYGGMAAIDAEIDQAPIRLLLDTAAGALFLFRINEPGKATTPDPLLVSEHTIGVFERKLRRIRTLKLGDTYFAQKNAYVVEDTKKAGLNYEGLLNPVELGIKKVFVDLGQGTIAFER